MSAYPRTQRVTNLKVQRHLGMQVLYEDKRDGFRECLGWSRNGSERSRMIPEVSGMVPGVSGMVPGIYGRYWKVLECTGRLWKVPEGSGTYRTILGSPYGSIIGVSTLPYGARSFHKLKFGLTKGGRILVGFGCRKPTGTRPNFGARSRTTQGPLPPIKGGQGAPQETHTSQPLASPSRSTSRRPNPSRRRRLAPPLPCAAPPSTPSSRRHLGDMELNPRAC